MSKTPQLLDKEISSSFNTIRKTLMHIADAEYIWHCRLKNLPFDKIPSKEGLGIESLAELDRKVIDFIGSKEDAYFGESTEYKTMKGDAFKNKNFSILTHLFNHGTFHRGQVVTMMRNGGFEGHIESTDLIAFERL
jgi:uncharacterized damage-inducible protein DinB